MKIEQTTHGDNHNGNNDIQMQCKDPSKGHHLNVGYVDQSWKGTFIYQNETTPSKPPEFGNYIHGFVLLTILFIYLNEVNPLVCSQGIYNLAIIWINLHNQVKMV